MSTPSGKREHLGLKARVTLVCINVWVFTSYLFACSRNRIETVETLSETVPGTVVIYTGTVTFSLRVYFSNLTI